MSIDNRLPKQVLALVGSITLLASGSLLFGCAPSTISEPTVSTEPTVSEPTVSEPTASEPTVSEPTISTEPTETAAPETLPNNSPDASVDSASPSGNDKETPLSEEERVVAERLASMGIENPEAVKTFLAEMRAAASSQNQEAIANLVHYPFTTYDSGEPLKTYESSAAFLEDFHQVVTPTVIEAMSNAQYSELFSNYQGVMIGNGEVWFDQVNQELKIKAINGDS